MYQFDFDMKRCAEYKCSRTLISTNLLDQQISFNYYFAQVRI
jgi:hypothetical protein